MPYSSSALSNLMKSFSLQESALTPGGGLTSAYNSMCDALGEAISERQNAWQDSARVTGIIVNGGICAVQGPLTAGIGIGPPGSIVGQVSGTGNLCKSLFPTSEMSDRTAALSSYVTSIGNGFQQIFNLFVSTSAVSNIIVNGGTCTCKIVLGAPVPGTYSGGTGILSSLTTGLSGVSVSANLLRTTMISMMDSNILAQGFPTEALQASIRSICSAIEQHHNSWLLSSRIEDLKVNGGVTFPFGPITASSGSGGVIV